MPNQAPILTWHDALEHCRGWLRGGADTFNEDDMYSATRAALREIAIQTEWAYHWTWGRITLEATYSTGTITYTHSTRQVTLAGGTWPTNAAYFQIRIADVNYKVEERTSSTVLTLPVDSNPGANVAAGTKYKLFRSEYNLPHGVRKLGTPIHETWSGMTYIEPDDFFWYEREVSNVSGTPFQYTITGDSNLHGSMALLIYPAAQTAKTVDFMYLRWPRQLKISGKATADTVGTVTTDGTSTIAGTTTTVSANHVGSVIRFGDSTTIPTGYDGRNQPADERVIMTRTSNTAFTTDQTVSTLTTVKYIISDPVDLDQSCFNAFFRNCELQLARRQRDYKVLPIIEGEYNRELLLAMQGDNRRQEKGYAIGAGGGMEFPFYDPPMWVHWGES